MRKTVVVVVSLLLLSSACKGSAERKGETKLAVNERMCAKLATLTTAPSTPAQKDRCLHEMELLGPNVRACFDPCIDRAKDKIDYEVCTDECISHSGLAASICERGYLWDQQGKAACVAALGPLQTSDHAKLACVSRCRHENEANAVETCAQRCGAPALPPRKKLGGPG